MNNFRVKFADVLRYAVLGIIELWVLFFVFKEDLTRCEIYKTIAYNTTIPVQSTLGALIALCIAYCCGYLTQTVIQSLLNGNLFGTGIEEVANYVRFNPLFPFNQSFPDWVYWSDEPDLVLRTYKDIMETSPNSENLTEFLSNNQLFQGIALFLTVTASTVLLHLDQSWVSISFVVLMAVLLVVSTILSNTNKIVLPVIIGRCIMPLIWLPFYMAGHGEVGIAFSIGIFFSIIFAECLSRRQIKRIDILANNNAVFDGEKDPVEKLKLKNTLLQWGIPKFYILTRTNTHVYLDEQLDSIAMQEYPNIKVIILIDSILAKGSSKAEIKNLIALKQKQYKQHINIQYYESKDTGPAALAYEIRGIFLDYANKDDFAMLLDADDLLASEYVVSRIVAKMIRTVSDICLIRFEVFGDKSFNYAKNYHNMLVKKYCDKKILGGRFDRRLSPRRIIAEGQMHHVSTIGWTKCCKQPVIEEYQRAWDNEFDILRKGIQQNNAKLSANEIEKQFKNNFVSRYKKYEDFPDIIMLLNRRRHICTVSKNSVMFRKTNNSVTTHVSRDNYEVQIPGFLHFAKSMIERGILEKSCDYNYSVRAWNVSTRSYEEITPQKVVVERLIPYKFIQYLLVIYAKKKDKDKSLYGFSCKTFYDKFISEMHFTDAELNTFHNSILYILQENKENRIFNEPIIREFDGKTVDIDRFREVFGFAPKAVVADNAPHGPKQ